jgi:uncharacterized membrane protein
LANKSVQRSAFKEAAADLNVGADRVGAYAANKNQGIDMKDAGHMRWLFGELPELVGQGVIQSDVVEKIRRHYGKAEMAGSTTKRWAIVLFSILGAVLIVGGIILLLAHNWEELSRPMRAAISVAPLLISASLGAWLLWIQIDSTAWREGVATAQTLSIGLSIALVAQTYNLGGRFDEFILTWSLLALPITYLLRATLPALLYLVGIMVWTGSVTNQTNSGLWYFPLLGLALPFVWWTSRPNRYHPRPVLFLWVLALTVCIGAGFATERVCLKMGAWPVVFGGLFTVFYLVGARWWGESPTVWQRPLQNVGALGAVGLALVLSFAAVWSHASWHHSWENVSFLRVGLELAAAAVFPIAALALWGQSWTRREWSGVILGAVSAMASVGWIAAMYDAEMISAVLFNLYLFVLGIGTLVIGLRIRRLGTVNAGMMVLAAVILCRFFDGDLSFRVRGIAFIVMGIGFLMTNLILMRRIRSVN